MAHADPEKQRASWRKNKQRQRKRVREDARGETQKQLRASASAGMVGGTVVTCWLGASDVNDRVARPEGTGWSAVRRVWVPEVPVVRLPDAIARLCVDGRQVTMLALLPALSAPQDWPVFLAAVEAAGVCVLVRPWIRQRQAAVLGFGVDPVRFTAAWQSWGLVLHAGVPKAAEVQQEPPQSQPRREPAPSEGTYSPWSGAAQPVAEDAPSEERTISVPPREGEDEFDRIHRRVFGKDMDELEKADASKNYSEIDKLLMTLEDRNLRGEELEDKAVELLRRRHKR